MKTKAAVKDEREPGRREAGRRTVADIREQAQKLIAEGRAEEAVEYLLSALVSVLDRERALELMVAKLRRERLGKTSERIDPKQLLLWLEDLEESPEKPPEVDLASEEREDEALTAEIESEREAKAKGKKSERKGTQVGPAVAREVHEERLADEDRVCSRCGRQRKTIGYDTTVRLEYVPGSFVEHEYRLEKIACSCCKDGVTTASAPLPVLPRSIAGASLLAGIAVAKAVDHMPLNRLARNFERVGVTIPRSTLSDWLAQTADLLEPITAALAERVLAAAVVRTDATGLKVLDPESPNNIEKGTIWAYVGDDRDVLFRYTPTGEGETGPWQFLAGRTGYVQADAASVFDRLFNGKAATAIEVNCLAHARRKLEELKETDFRVAYPLKLIARLYRLEELADLRGLGPAERSKHRKKRSRPVLDRLRRWCQRTLASDVPSAAIVKAAAYFLNHWAGLTRFVDDGRLSLDNNLCEQQIRAVAMGRRNYLFAGSHEAAQRIALLYSLTRTCAQHGVAPLPYLTDVLTKLASGWPAERMAELLPDRWRVLISADASPAS